MARTFNDKTWHPAGWLDLKTVKPKLGESVLVAMENPENGHITYEVCLYAKYARDRRLRAFFRNFPHLLSSDGTTMEGSVWAYRDVVAWMCIPPYKL